MSGDGKLFPDPIPSMVFRVKIFNMKGAKDPSRKIVRKLSLNEDKGERLPVGKTPEERLSMMWGLAQDCWAFVPGYDAEQEFQRHIVSVKRRKG
ncbi:MAG: hypothetical protein R2684_14200 [Pyrinomonadaceae bacterium]